MNTHVYTEKRNHPSWKDLFANACTLELQSRRGVSLGLRLRSCHSPSLQGISRVCSHLLVLAGPPAAPGLLGAAVPRLPQRAGSILCPRPLQVSGSGACGRCWCPVVRGCRPRWGPGAGETRIRPAPSAAVLAGSRGSWRTGDGSAGRRREPGLGWAGLSSSGSPKAAEKPLFTQILPWQGSGRCPSLRTVPSAPWCHLSSHQPCGCPALWWTLAELALNLLFGLSGCQPRCFIASLCGTAPCPLPGTQGSSSPEELLVGQQGPQGAWLDVVGIRPPSLGIIPGPGWEGPTALVGTCRCCPQVSLPIGS